MILKDLNKRTTILAAVSLILASVAAIPSAAGSEVCFSQFNDSAWATGEPSEVTAALNFNLVGEKKSWESYLEDTSLNLLSGGRVAAHFLFDQSQVATTYTYTGKDCTKRVIQVKGSGFEPVVNSLEDLKIMIETNSTNFVESAKSISALDAIASSLDGAKVVLPVGKNLVTSPTWGYSSPFEKLISRKSVDAKLKSVKFTGQMIFPLIYLKFDPKCLEIVNRSEVWGIPKEIKTYGFLIPNQGNIPFNIKFKNKTGVCKSDIYFTSRAANSPQGNYIARIGTLGLAPRK